MKRVRIYPFKLGFQDGRALFPFIMEGLPPAGIGCALSSRSAGNMVYSAGVNSPARRGFYESLGLDPPGVFACTQVHSRDVLVIDRHSPNTGPRADGMVSRDRAAYLSVTVADCLPVFLYDTEGGGFGLVHSGWRGTGIVLAALRLMTERWNARPEAVAAVLGPCIQGCCYRVDEERARAFEDEFGGPGGVYPLGPVVRREGADPYLDLPAANARLLAGAGVRNIAVCEDCTYTDERLGSFRREGAGKNPKDPSAYTRMAAVLGRL